MWEASVDGHYTDVAIKCQFTTKTTGRGVVLAIFYVFYPIFLRSSRETFVSPIIILHEPQRFTYEMNFHKGERTLIGDPLIRCVS